MPSVSSNGPNWIRRQKARTDRDLEGLGPVRRFLAKLFGRDADQQSGAAPRGFEAPHDAASSGADAPVDRSR